ncbi:molybdopterin-guanine dinucleotide biosynthesis protein B [Desulfovibrio litoralis]|uniref:Molybdopterin-guanine dinucleotide biosynthesis protein B n=1 Tax=Desulfovibrio litoralis DSM 11393 TaxID=1121455 RepID=A0A1M7T6U8_9BACT|nr:molybdopterin-guanine dinucleotide biosynthesis protein B [Desulfovibrio litoralis]SHN66439.1 molybdopterin-guanine dinucleotide biosynthesis protein B [Desulfovibrio litoralis DSM 11393]
MKAIAIVGYKNSGKTTTTLKLAEALEKKGLKVAIAKHTHHNFDKENTDTARFQASGRDVIGIGADESAIFYGEFLPLLKLIPFIKADILLVEGNKNATWLPRIVCLREAEEINELSGAKTDESTNSTRQTIATLRKKPLLNCFEKVAHFELTPQSEAKDFEQLADLVWEKSFILPGLNCGACGFESCATFASQIVKGVKTTKDCPSLNTESVEIYANDQKIALNPFMARLVGGMLKAVAVELKGYDPNADLVIRLNKPL